MNFLTASHPINQITKSSSFITKFLNNFHWDQILANLASKIITLILVSFLFYIIGRIGNFFISRSYGNYLKKHPETEKRSNTLSSLTHNIFQYGLGFFWIYSLLSIIGIPIGTLIAGAGIFSIAIGLGAQTFVSDIVSGFFILFERQIDVGEFVTIDNVTGTVTGVGLRTTKVTSPDGTLNFVPNHYITTIANMSRNQMKAIIKIRIDPKTQIDKAIATIKEVDEEKMHNYPEIIGEPDIWRSVNLPDAYAAIQINIPTKNGAQWMIQHEFLAFYLEAMRKNDVNLPSIYYKFNN
ncbi:mechanosensitive ion channel protein MscS [Philodulcilactobacillus myokoensis]|uniref:Mechanosensitive ion channel protein MscS n=1 Tax=Philodulcilactobacillus myokoensis TaxID=2929573 RepID=A0A9W6B221_9LACO|nr:mechanosensitive ion channel family protein [Philodulcilactobacillus myokoensis]GLB46694.1 mechanosensitive ion channel protein MscS [Philodulcilactobacillus myokoensis]